MQSYCLCRLQMYNVLMSIYHKHNNRATLTRRGICNYREFLSDYLKVHYPKILQESDESKEILWSR